MFFINEEIEMNKKFKAKPVNDVIYKMNLADIEMEKMERKEKLWSETKTKHES